MNNNEIITMGNIKTERPKNIFTILSEINSEMDALSSELNTTLSFIDNRNIDRENEEMRQLLNKATQLTKDIDLMESIPKSVENKCIQSDNEDYNSSPEPRKNTYENQDNNSPKMSYQRQYEYDNKKEPPFDPNKNKYYYSTLGSNSIQNNNYNYQNQMMSNRYPNFNTSRVKRMDELYQGKQFSNRMPIIYSQNEVNGSRTFDRGNNNLNGSFRINNNNNTMSGYNSNNEYGNNQGQRPFERYKPGSISQAMDILLDKQ